MEQKRRWRCRCPRDHVLESRVRAMMIEIDVPRSGTLTKQYSWIINNIKNNLVIPRKLTFLLFLAINRKYTQPMPSWYTTRKTSTMIEEPRDSGLSGLGPISNETTTDSAYVSNGTLLRLHKAYCDRTWKQIVWIGICLVWFYAMCFIRNNFCLNNNSVISNMKTFELDNKQYVMMCIY